MTTIALPESCLVLLVGASGAGKSTFARRHFGPTEVVSSDACRAAVADDPNDQSATADAFELLHSIVDRRLARGRLTVVDATSVQRLAREPLRALARRHDVRCVVIVLDVPGAVLDARRVARTDRDCDADVVERQRADLARSLRTLPSEGFRHVHRLTDVADIDATTVVRVPLPSNRRAEHGPFDIVGDVHGCLDELLALCDVLGYRVARTDDGWSVVPPADRRLLFVGDLVDRGPDSPGVVHFVRAIVDGGQGFCVAGNHDAKLARALRGRAVQVGHGLERSLAQLADADDAERDGIARFLERLPGHLVLDDGRLVVAHAGLREALQGRASGRARAFAMYGLTTGETDAFGLPVRQRWADDYRGDALVVHGHTPVVEPEWINGTICIDTGCVFGGRLTALRYPERELVSVPARRPYDAPARPID